MEKELKIKKGVCAVGEEIDEYLDGTICAVVEEDEDITVPNDEKYEVNVEEEIKEDDTYKDFIK